MGKLWLGISLGLSYRFIKFLEKKLQIRVLALVPHWVIVLFDVENVVESFF